MNTKLADDKRPPIWEMLTVPKCKPANADVPIWNAAEARAYWETRSLMAADVKDVLLELTCDGKEPIPPDVTLFIQTMTALRAGAGVDAWGRCKMSVTAAAKEALDQFEYVSALVS